MTMGAQTNLSKEIGFFADQMQALENAAQDVYSLRSVAAATGKTLDNVGSQVGASRPAGMGDADFRDMIYGTIAMNVAGGTPEQLIAALRILIGDSGGTVPIKYWEGYPYYIFMEFDLNETPPDNLFTYMQNLCAAVRKLNLFQGDATLPFRFDSATNGLDNGKLESNLL